MHNVILQNQMDAIDNTKGVSFKDAYIRANIKKDFVQADFRGTKWKKNILVKNVVFTECDFSGAEITADIICAKFIRCNFEGATFRCVNIYKSAFINNNFKQTHFIYSSIHKTELSKDDFEKAKMDDTYVEYITVNEPNRNYETIQYGCFASTEDELKQMKADCTDELAGVGKLPEEYKTYDTIYDDLKQKSFSVLLKAVINFEINHGTKDKRDKFRYLVDRYCKEEKYGSVFMEEKLEKYNKIAEQKYGADKVEETEG